MTKKRPPTIPQEALKPDAPAMGTDPVDSVTRLNELAGGIPLPPIQMKPRPFANLKGLSLLDSCVELMGDTPAHNRGSRQFRVILSDGRIGYDGSKRNGRNGPKVYRSRS